MKSFSTPSKALLKQFRGDINVSLAESLRFHPTLQLQQLNSTTSAQISPEIVISHYLERLYKIFASYAMFRAHGAGRELTMDIDQALVFSRHYGLCPALLSHNEIKQAFAIAAAPQHCERLNITPQKLTFDTNDDSKTRRKVSSSKSSLLAFTGFLRMLQGVAKQSDVISTSFLVDQESMGALIIEGLNDAAMTQAHLSNDTSNLNVPIERQRLARQLELLFYLMDEAIVDRTRTASKSLQRMSQSESERGDIKPIDMIKARRFAPNELARYIESASQLSKESSKGERLGTASTWLGAPRLHWVGFLMRSLTNDEEQQKKKQIEGLKRSMEEKEKHDAHIHMMESAKQMHSYKQLSEEQRRMERDLLKRLRKKRYGYSAFEDYSDDEQETESVFEENLRRVDSADSEVRRILNSVNQKVNNMKQNASTQLITYSAPHFLLQEGKPENPTMLIKMEEGDAAWHVSPQNSKQAKKEIEYPLSVLKTPSKGTVEMTKGDKMVLIENRGENHGSPLNVFTQHSKDKIVIPIHLRATYIKHYVPSIEEDALDPFPLAVRITK